MLRSLGVTRLEGVAQWGWLGARTSQELAQHQGVEMSFLQRSSPRRQPHPRSFPQHHHPHSLRNQRLVLAPSTRRCGAFSSSPCTLALQWPRPYWITPNSQLAQSNAPSSPRPRAAASLQQHPSPAKASTSLASARAPSSPSFTLPARFARLPAVPRMMQPRSPPTTTPYALDL
jgi:hypothetical protein